MTAAQPSSAPGEHIAEVASRAQAAGQTLAGLSLERRSQLLNACADQLGDDKVRQHLFSENQKDLDNGEQLIRQGRLEASAFKRLGLSAAKLDSLGDGLRQLARQPDIVGRRLQHRRLDDGLVLEQVSAPLGLVGIVFESRPDAVPQFSGLAIKSGNALILKGGREALHSNRALVDTLQQILAAHDVAPAAISLIEAREEVSAMLGLNTIVDMVVARGSSKFVQYVMDNSKIPVMGHAEGLCHLYLHASATPDMATAIAVDSKASYPAACNAIETLLWDISAEPAVRSAIEALQQAGVKLRGCPHTVALGAGPMAVAEQADWSCEYGAMTLSIKRVDDLNDALHHIRQYGSGHTETIIAQDADVAERFLSEVDAACIFHNASSRFADGYRFGLGAEVGISTGKLHARGPVGVAGLMTSRWILRGSGQLSESYGSGKRAFTHEDLPLTGEG